MYFERIPKIVGAIKTTVNPKEDPDKLTMLETFDYVAEIIPMIEQYETLTIILDIFLAGSRFSH